MEDLVAAAIKACLPCARGKARFREFGRGLQPLPIRGLRYRLGMDVVDPLPLTKATNYYVMVCIEHLTI